MAMLISLAHEFLRRFCLGNASSQNFLYTHVQYGHGGSASKALKIESTQDVETLTAIFKENVDLCSNVQDSLLEHVFTLLHRQERSSVFLRFLQTVVKAGDRPIPRTQSQVMVELSRASDDVMLLFNDPTSFQRLVQLMQDKSALTLDNSELVYHIQLVKLLSLCTEGKNSETELKAASLLTINDIMRVLSAKSANYYIKNLYVNFLFHCYVDTDVEIIKDSSLQHRLWQIFGNIAGDMEQLWLCGPHDDPYIYGYAVSTCARLLTSYFNRLVQEEHPSPEMLQQNSVVITKLVKALHRIQGCEWLEKNGHERIERLNLILSNLVKRRNVVLSSQSIEEDDLNAECAILPATMNAMGNVTAARASGAKWKRVQSRKTMLSARSSTDFRSIVEHLTNAVDQFESIVQPLVDVEFSVLITILHEPYFMFPSGTEYDQHCRDGRFLEKLISHCRLLHSEKQESLCVKLLRTLRKMVVYVNRDKSAEEQELQGFSPDQRIVRDLIQQKYLNQNYTMQQPTSRLTILAAMVSRRTQGSNDQAGGSSLIIDILIANPSHRVFLEAIEYAKALLNGGNTTVQTSFFDRMRKSPEISEKFFQILHDKIKIAENKLRSAVPATPLDMLAGRSPMSTPRRNSGMITIPSFPSMFNPPKFSDQSGGSASGDHLSISDDSQHAVRPKLSIGVTPAEFRLNTSSGGKDIAGVGKDFQTQELLVIEPIFRFLQLLCENHNRDLQNFLRLQGTKSNFDMVSATLTFLDVLCGSTTGSLGLLGMYINQFNVELLNQTLATLTEYCQGPCHQNQNTIASHESNGLDVIISLILNEIRPLSDTESGMNAVAEVKSNASKLLLAIMESSHDGVNADRIISNMKRMSSGPTQLIEVINEARKHEEGLTPVIKIGILEEEQNEPQHSFDSVGHNTYILAHQLAPHHKELDDMLRSDNCSDAIKYYRDHTGEIEIVREDGTLEKIVFPIDEICNQLTDETKRRVFYESEPDNQGSKVDDFFNQREDLISEMKWQKNLKKQNWLFMIARNIRYWSRLSYFFGFLINFLVMLFFPFTGSESEYLPGLFSSLLLCLLLALLMYKMIGQEYGLHLFGISLSLRLIMCIIPMRYVLWLLGAIQIANKAIHILSYVANHGSHTSGFSVALRDSELIALFIYLGFCICGLCINELFYSVLLLDIALQEETLRNVIRSVTRNWRSIALTALLAIILVYLFAIIGHLYFPNDFIGEHEAMPLRPGLLTQSNSTVNITIGANITTDANDTCTKDSCPTGAGGSESAGGTSVVEAIETEEEDKYFACDNLWNCLVQALNCGMRSGGGIGECLRKRSPDELMFMLRVVYDLLFFFIINLIVLNLIFGVIIDTFGDLRNERKEKADALQNTCFICGLGRAEFNNKRVTFKDHCNKEHYIWSYLYFLVLLKHKPDTEYTGPESYVDKLTKDHARALDWFPKLRAMSLDLETTVDPEQNEMKVMQAMLKENMENVCVLSRQLESLRNQMNQQRSRRERESFFRSNDGLARNLRAL